MALLNFKASSEDKLRGILGAYVTEEDRPRLRSTDSYVEKFYYKVTQIIQGTIVGTEETYTEYKAIQVNPDGTEVENGVVFDSDQEYKDEANSPLYLPNLKINEELFSGSVELGKAYQVEEVDPDDISTGLEPVYYIIPKGGGGTAYSRVRLPNGASTAYNGVTGATVEVLDDSDNVISTVGNVVQRKYSTAIIYENEIMLGEINGDICDVTISMSGLGTGAWSE